MNTFKKTLSILSILSILPALSTTAQATTEASICADAAILDAEIQTRMSKQDMTNMSKGALVGTSIKSFRLRSKY